MVFDSSSNNRKEFPLLSEVNVNNLQGGYPPPSNTPLTPDSEMIEKWYDDVAPNLWQATYLELKKSATPMKMNQAMKYPD